MNDGTEHNSGNRQWLDDIIVHEMAFERRVRRAAITAWSVTFGILPLLGVALFLINSWARDAAGRDAIRAALIVLGIGGILSVFAAVLLTAAWLFRSRAPTLAAIERRLAALETILLSRS